MANFFKVAKVGDIAPGEMVGVDIEDTKVAIANVDGEFYAFGSECTHAMGWLHEGFLEGGIVECPVHFAAFDVRTGRVKQPPAGLPVQTYPLRVDGDDIEIEYS